MTMNSKSNKNNPRQIGGANLYFDQDDAVLLREGLEVKLDANTAKLLGYFLDNPDTIIPRSELTEKVWASGFASDNAINRCVSILRKELGGDLHRFITTIPKKGYRFSHGEQPPISQPINTVQQRSFKPQLTGAYLLLTVFVVGLMVYFFGHFSSSYAPPSGVGAVKVQANSISVAVLPFTTKNNGPEQLLFVDGLSQEIVNNLTKTPRLVVHKTTKTLASNDAKQLGHELGVGHLLTGTIRKMDKVLRVTVQLIDARTGVYLFSSNFDRTVKDAFAVQQGIGEQVAAALRLSLIHKTQQYSSALAKMDYKGVEQLVINRALLNDHREARSRQAFDSLIVLNQRFPQTPEVLGLLSLAYDALAKTKANDGTAQLQIQADLAERALVMDPTNGDALKSLYYYYTDMPLTREKGYALSESFIHNHSGKQDAYRTRLHLMINTMTPCDEIQRFVKTIPNGVFKPRRLAVINHILDTCQQQASLEGLTKLNTQVSPEKMTSTINNNLYFFRLRHDMTFDAVKSLTRRDPAQSFLADYYWLQLTSGAVDQITATQHLINTEGFWPWLIALYNQLYSLPSQPNVRDQTGYFDGLSQYKSGHQYAAVLVSARNQGVEDRAYVQYLSSLEHIPINLFNASEVIALMMLQYHRGQNQQAQQTGKKLFNKLKRYQQNHLQSFHFWGLGRFYLIAKFHCAQLCDDGSTNKGSEKQLLDELFSSEYALWFDDIAFTRVALSPWASDPVVIEYLGRIAQDRLRFIAR